MRIVPRLKLSFFPLIALLAIFGGCSHGESTLRTVELWFSLNSGGESARLTMEVAATDSERAKGLMFRKTLPPDHGMIFVFTRESPHAFWMKNTVIPLDMVFVSEQWRVVGFLQDVPPLTEDPRSIEAHSRYVLEFSAGTVKRLGLHVGAQVNIRGDLPRGS